MAIYRCKMCGGDLAVKEGSSFCECEFCGTRQTIPTINDNGLITLFNRANTLRMKAEFDKAAEIYEKILQKNSEESEAYWGLILCKYGIEYVEDPDSYMRVPTCHRASYDAVVTDEDYLNALKFADSNQKVIFENEAKAIDEIQKGIIAVAQKEDPYDVFICYKETDDSGRRTEDSVIANDIYYQLIQEGYKVFYAAITLEDKLGSEYEPQIFSALNSAKVMLAIGTKPEYFNSVWVKNEWSRYIKILKEDRSRLLIPCYRDMDAYDLPEEFAHLQSQDMSKIGFINDLIRGIKKVIVKNRGVELEVSNKDVEMKSSNDALMIRRGQLSLEDEEWDEAREFFNRALDENPESGEAYYGLLMTEFKKKDNDEMKQLYFVGEMQRNRFYKRVIQFKSERLENIFSRWEVEKAEKKSKEEEDKRRRKLLEEEENRRQKLLEIEKNEKRKESIKENILINKNIAKLLVSLSELYTDEERIEMEKLADSYKTLIYNEMQLDYEYRALPEHFILKSRNDEKKNLKSELLSISALKFKRKKEIQAKIEEIDNNRDLINNIITDKAKALEDCRKQKEFACNKLKEYKNSIRKEYIDQQKMDILNRIKLEIEKYNSVDEGLTFVDENTVLFGSYLQNSDCKERIKWRILDYKDQKLLLLADQIIDNIDLDDDNTPYDVGDGRIFRTPNIWDKSYLREYLNNNFYNEAFTDTEKSLIERTEISAGQWSGSAADTVDKVFLLTLLEAEYYLPSAKERICKPTVYAMNQELKGVHYTGGGLPISERLYVSEDDGGTSHWLLRSINKTSYYHDGKYLNYYDRDSVDTDGTWGLSESFEDTGLRPALWINLDF